MTRTERGAVTEWQCFVLVGSSSEIPRCSRSPFAIFESTNGIEIHTPKSRTAALLFPLAAPFVVHAHRNGTAVAKSAWCVLSSLQSEDVCASHTTKKRVLFLLNGRSVSVLG